MSGAGADIDHVRRRQRSIDGRFDPNRHGTILCQVLRCPTPENRIDLVRVHATVAPYQVGKDCRVVASACTGVDDFVAMLRSGHADRQGMEARLAAIELSLGSERDDQILIQHGRIVCLALEVAVRSQLELPGARTQELLSWNRREGIDDARGRHASGGRDRTRVEPAKGGERRRVEQHWIRHYLKPPTAVESPSARRHVLAPLRQE